MKKEIKVITDLRFETLGSRPRLVVTKTVLVFEDDKLVDDGKKETVSIELPPSPAIISP